MTMNCYTISVLWNCQREGRPPGRRHDSVLLRGGQQAPGDEVVGGRGDSRDERPLVGERRLVPDDVEEGEAVVSGRGDALDRDVVLRQSVVALDVGHTAVDRAEHDLGLDPAEVGRMRLRVADVPRL